MWLEGGLCYGARGAGREAWELWLCWFTHFAPGRSHDTQPLHLCLYPLVLVHLPPAASFQPVKQCLEGEVLE